MIRANRFARIALRIARATELSTLSGYVCVCVSECRVLSGHNLRDRSERANAIGMISEAFAVNGRVNRDRSRDL